MITKRILAVVFLPFLVVSFLQAQSLVELAKKEKERRAALKEKGIVVTNADLVKVKKRPAIEILPAEELPDEIPVEGEEVVPIPEEGEIPPGSEEAIETAAGEEAQPQIIPPPDRPTMTESEFRRQYADYQGRVDQAQEMIDLYTLKMNGLWQEFYSLDDMKSRELIQLQISETNEKLVAAQVDALTAKDELDNFIANARREGVPDIWIR